MNGHDLAFLLVTVLRTRKDFLFAARCRCETEFVRDQAREPLSPPTARYASTSVWIYRPVTREKLCQSALNLHRPVSISDGFAVGTPSISVGAA